MRGARLFIITVSGRGNPPERYEISNHADYEDARREACRMYGRKYGLGIIGPMFETKMENPDA